MNLEHRLGDVETDCRDRLHGSLASPWQNGFAERLIGSIRRECSDHVVVLGETHLRRILKSYADYYNSVRTPITTSEFEFSVHTGLSAQVTHCQSRHPLQRRRSVSIDLGTESMPELEPGTKRRASVMRTPWSAVLWAAPSRAGPRHSRTGLRSPSRQ